jgi:hypothetical protein
MKKFTVLKLVVFCALATPHFAFGQPKIPERMGVVNVIPNDQSGEGSNNTEPSIAMGSGANSNLVVVHTFSAVPGSLQASQIFTSQDAGVDWAVSGLFQDFDATLAWSDGGPAYLAYLGYPPGGNVQIWYSPNPAVTNFVPIGSATFTGNLDQPRITTVNVDSVDHIYIGYNNLGSPTGQTASVDFSLDGGYSWQNISIEPIAPGAGQDSPAVPVAVSADGKTVYALFQRWNIPSGADYIGPAVLVRDDNSGLDGFTDLPLDSNGAHETLVDGNYQSLPWGSTLGVQRLGSGCSLAINPNHPNEVYVAFTTPEIGAEFAYGVTVWYSTDSGASFFPVLNVPETSSLPALAVTTEGTVGLLYLGLNNENQFFEVHLLEAFNGNFNDASDRILAQFPNNSPSDTFGQPYLGDYFGLKAVGHNFYGVFSASGDPQASHFPQGVYYQRNVKYGSSIRSGFSLTNDGGQLVDQSGNAVAPSIDPFFFYDIAPALIHYPILELIPATLNYVSDPMTGLTHLLWPKLPTNYPPFFLETCTDFVGNITWDAAPNVVETNGLLESVLNAALPNEFYRLAQDLTGATFSIFTAVQQGGMLTPNGVVSVAGGMSKMFTATPMSGYAVGKWYVDGTAVQTGGTSLTISNVSAEHTVLASFTASNDLAVTVQGLPLAQGPVLVSNEVDYTITVVNDGLNPLTGVVLTNQFDPTVILLSANASLGSLNTNTPGVLTANIGPLSPGSNVVVTCAVLPTEIGLITNSASVGCDQSEPELANNTAVDILNVLAPLEILEQPQSQSVPLGEYAAFNVSVSGSPPISYQWCFDGVALNGETNSALVIPSVSNSLAGSYSVAVTQIPAGPEDLIQINSDSATLAVLIDAPIAETLPASSISSNNAVLNGYLAPDGASTVYRFEYGLTTAYGSSTPSSVFGIGNPNDIVQTLTNLTSSTIYHFRLDASNSQGTVYGADISFTTLSDLGPPGPTVETMAATSVTTNSAALNCSIFGNGSAIAGYFEYGLTTNYTENTRSLQFYGAGNPTEDYFTEISGLSPSTTYHYRAVAFNATPNEGIGADMTFTTLAATGQIVPTVETLAATSITTTSAILSATVNPNGVETHGYFEYGTTTNYGNTTALEDLGTATFPEDLQYELTLASATTYHYRIVAYSDGGTNLGADVSFTTGIPAQPVPTVQTLAASSITSDSAILNSSIDPNGADTKVFYQYGISTNYGDGTATEDIGSGNANVGFPSIVSLSPSTTYHYRIIAYNSGGTAFGNDTSFTTLPSSQPAPTVQTLAASAITSSSATFNATVDPNGVDTQFYFQYGTTTAYGNTTTTIDIGSGASAESVSFAASLSPNTTWHYRIVAYNSGGTNYGADVSFATTPLPPIVATLAASSISSSGAIVNASVNPNGADTQVYFQYGTTTSYGSSTPAEDIGSGSLVQEIQSDINLSANTTYHYRIVASNSGGISYGADMNFTTPAFPPVVTTLAATSITASTAVLNSSINPNGAQAAVYFQYGFTTSYGNTTPGVQLYGGSQSYGTEITGLIELTRYHFRVVASNNGGTTYGADQYFVSGGEE